MLLLLALMIPGIASAASNEKAYKMLSDDEIAAILYKNLPNEHKNMRVATEEEFKKIRIWQS